MMAMIRLWKSELLRSLGWKLLLQIHDEVILEGPKESRDEAMKEVRSIMENPYDNVGLSKLKGTVCAVALLCLFSLCELSQFIWMWTQRVLTLGTRRSNWSS